MKTLIYKKLVGLYIINLVFSILCMLATIYFQYNRIKFMLGKHCTDEILCLCKVKILLLLNKYSREYKNQYPQ